MKTGLRSSRRNEGQQDILLRAAIDGFVATSVVDIKNCASLLGRCTAAKDLASGKRLHQHIAALELDRNKVVGNQLLRMYGICGCIQEARAAFDKIQNRNVLSSNLMITAYAQNGHLQEAKETFDAIPVPTTVSWNAMMAAFSQHGAVSEAKRVFDAMPLRNVVSWNGMISGFAQNEQHSEALHIFRLMDLEGLQADGLTFVSALDACAKLKALVEGETIFKEVMLRGLQTNVFVGTALVNMYGKFGNIDKAETIFNMLPDRNVVTWTSMFSLYAMTRPLEVAKAFFDAMPRKNVISWNVLLAVYAQKGYVDEVTNVFNSMNFRDSGSWGTLVAAYAHNDHGKRALKAFKTMDLEGFHPNRLTFMSIFDACGDISALPEGRIIHSSIEEGPLKFDVVLHNTILNMYGKCGSMQDAQNTFDQMPQRSDVSWTTMVTAYAHNGQGDEALEFFLAMNLEGIIPEHFTFISVLSVCAHAGLAKDARDYFVSMLQDYEVTPGLDHYICIIDVLGRSGRLFDAEILIQTMPFEPPIVSWLTLLGACKVQKNITMAKHVARQIFMIDPSTSAPFALLSSMFSEHGMSKELHEMRQAMLNKQSSIDVPGGS